MPRIACEAQRPDGSGVISTLIGAAGAAGSADGVWTASRFDGPAAMLALAPRQGMVGRNSMMVADLRSRRLRMVTDSRTGYCCARTLPVPLFHKGAQAVSLTQLGSGLVVYSDAQGTLSWATCDGELGGDLVMQGHGSFSSSSDLPLDSDTSVAVLADSSNPWGFYALYAPLTSVEICDTVDHDWPPKVELWYHTLRQVQATAQGDRRAFKASAERLFPRSHPRAVNAEDILDGGFISDLFGKLEQHSAQEPAGNLEGSVLSSTPAESPRQAEMLMGLHEVRRRLRDLG